MGKVTGISWCDHTFSPWWGCFKVSPGCQHCYAETLATRFGHNIWGPPSVTRRHFMSDQYWRTPWRWDDQAKAAGKRRRVFPSLCDPFEDHPDVSGERDRLWELIAQTPNLDWMLLTKRPENVMRMLPDNWDGGWPNVWFGTSVESNDYRERIQHLAEVVCSGDKFLSCEPLLGPLDLSDEDPRDGYPPLSFISWVIVGGESGPGYRDMDLAWAADIREQCFMHDVPFFFKQRSGPRSGMLDGVPDDLLVQEVPRV